MTDKNAIIHTLPDGSEELFVSKDPNGSSTSFDKTVELDYQNIAEPVADGIHQMYVPHGQKMKLTLSDGTRVWLNSGSSFSFPSQFLNEGQRLVSLQGEAYFEVEKDENLPFIVKTDKMNIEVLGTEFNVSAYSDDSMIATTLVEGSVSLYEDNLKEERIILRPNQQGTFDKNTSNLVSTNVDVTLFTAWKNNKIVFKDLTMGQILKQIERAYDVEVKNDNETIILEKFTGEFDNESVETIFKALSTSLSFTYEIQQQHVHIKK